MLKMLERNIETIERRLVLVAPPQGHIPRSFRHVQAQTGEHSRFIREAQRLRGSVYLADGALQRHQLSPDGLHQTPEDECSWHLLFTNGTGNVTACIWYREHAVDASFEDLRVKNSALAHESEWRPRLWYAVEWDLARARAEDLPYGEVGGWAVSKESTCTEGLLLALAAYGLAHTLGGAQVMTTATHRHSSAAILRRIGGSPLLAKGEEIPPYYDAKYDCNMEILRFDSRHPNARFAPLVNMLRRKLCDVPTVASVAAQPLLQPPLATPDAYVA
jgi:hypothetical protein